MIRRTLAHPATPEPSWSSVALHLELTDAQRGGFQLTLFYDTGRAPAQIFLRPRQLDALVELAAQSACSDQELWAELGKIPLEPMPYSRGLAPRLRWLLVDHAAAIREKIRALLAVAPPLPEAAEEQLAEADAVHAVTSQTDPSKMM